jgi:hypothetical protein
MVLRRFVVWMVVVGVVGVSACAAGVNVAADVEEEPDAEGENPEMPPPPPGAPGCAEDQHACGEYCVGDRPNEPDLGCALGCGTPCTAPENGVASCRIDGTCDFSCPSPWARVGGACVLTACADAGYACGALVDDANQNIACGSCFGSVGCAADHQCDVARDAREPNNTVAQATNLGAFNDYDDPTMWVDNLSIDERVDADWFRFQIVDGFDAGNPDATIQLAKHAASLGWLDASHELTVWFKCNTANAGSRVRCGEWYTTSSENTLNDPTLGVGCAVSAQYVVWADIAASCTGTTDSGTATIRVRKTQAPLGDTFDLHVGVD